MGKISPQELLRELEKVVAILAAPASEQAKWLAEGRVVVPVDELALQLNDAEFSWFPRLRRHHLLSAGSERSLKELHDAIEAMSSPDDTRLWESNEALFVHPEWENVRHIAKKALAEIRKTLAETVQQPGQEKCIGP